MGIEELQIMGYNVINFTLDLGRDVEYAGVSFEYIMALNKLRPVALIVHPNPDKVKNMNMEYVMKILLKYNGYLYGSQEAVGFLLPIKDNNIKYFIKNTVPKFVEEIFGYRIEPRITGYTIDLQL
ncbi:MAG: hypothetical protein QXG46_03835 [Ignisphaera sp.]|uniref:Uncharacterized protein n=1 Tax=Ignisphaera aggregans TaxID=334771 RepID=A0A7C4D0A5_9CREN